MGLKLRPASRSPGPLSGSALAPRRDSFLPPADARWTPPFPGRVSALQPLPAAQFSLPGPGGPEARRPPGTPASPRSLSACLPGGRRVRTALSDRGVQRGPGCSLSPLTRGSLGRFLKGLTGCRKHPLPEVGGPPPRHAPPRPLHRPALSGGLLRTALPGRDGRPGCPRRTVCRAQPCPGAVVGPARNGGMPARELG